MAIRSYLNQTAVWKEHTGYNSNGEATFSTQSNIAVRWESGCRLVLNKEGHEVTSQATVFCVEKVKAGDVLNFDGRDWPVITVFSIPSLGGLESHREVAV